MLWLQLTVSIDLAECSGALKKSGYFDDSSQFDPFPECPCEERGYNNGWDGDLHQQARTCSHVCQHARAHARTHAGVQPCMCGCSERAARLSVIASCACVGK